MTPDEIEVECERYRVTSITFTWLHGGGWSVLATLDRSDPERELGQPRIVRASHGTLSEAIVNALESAGASRHATELAFKREEAKRRG